MANLQSVPKQWSWNAKLVNFANFAKLPKKTELLEKFKLLDKKGLELTEVRKERMIPVPQPTLIHKLSMMSMVWNVSIGQLGLAMLPPSSCTCTH